MSGTEGRILFDNVTGNRQDVVSCHVQLSILFCRLHAFAACAVKKSPLSNVKRNQALYLRRVLAKLEVFSVAHAGDQLLRLFAERIEFLSLVQILHERVPVRVILELLNQSCDDFLVIRIFFLDG